MSDYALLYITCPSEDSAQKLAVSLLEARLIACANILPVMRALYEWGGKLCDESECVLLAKTAKHQVEAATRQLAELHPYECPCIVEIPIVSGHLPFLNWIDTQTASSETSFR